MPPANAFCIRRRSGAKRVWSLWGNAVSGRPKHPVSVGRRVSCQQATARGHRHLDDRRHA